MSLCKVNGGKTVPKGDEVAMMEAVYQVPVMATIDASPASFELYRNGIYEDPQCSPDRLDHVLQVVGYGSEHGQDYWICKNSWGELISHLLWCVIYLELILCVATIFLVVVGLIEI